ncbi:hypothetical protein AAVH_10520 [Aphelenchoides avenae]|nr:hypothetical protein AAVH_10518 [Aphelenchus avenae]KAH7722024.1 hypothetical protein AAVH_10520 [Aphelenchus avenae]
MEEAAQATSYVGIDPKKWTVSDVLAAAIVLATEQYESHQIGFSGQQSCEVEIAFEGPFSFRDTVNTFSPNILKEDGSPMYPSASTARIAYSFHGKKAITRILGLHEAEAVSTVFNAVRVEFIKPFDTLFVNGGGHFDDKALEEAEGYPKLNEFLFMMEPYMEANPNHNDDECYYHFMRAFYIAHGFFARLLRAAL